MGDFTAVPDLDQIVARMVGPEVRKIAVKVEVAAKRLAPAGKRWVSMADNVVRDTHRVAAKHGQIPTNLRFEVPAQPWDVEHGLSPGVDYLLYPKDTSTGLPLDSVQHVHCRCKQALDPAAFSAKIRTGPVRITGAKVTVEVTCTAAHVLGAEYGDTYPTGLVAPGTHFMGRAAARVAGAGGYGPTVDPTAAQTGGPGTGAQDSGGR